jgi:hypothetical protein
MTDRDRLLERLKDLDPVETSELEHATRDEEPTRRRILAMPVDELARRRVRRRRAAAAVAAAVAAGALLVPLVLLLPLSDDRGPGRGPARPGAVTGPSPGDAAPPSSGAITVTAPAPGTELTSPARITGDADVFETTVSIRILDATNNVIADTFTTATCGTGCRGGFSEEVSFSVGTAQPGVIQVFEVSAKDGSRINVVRIPVTLVPGPPDPVAAQVEGTWTDLGGAPAPDGTEGRPLVIHTIEGPDHCGWSSVTMLHVGWPVGTPTDGGGFRQYLRDPHGVLRDRVRVAYEPEATLAEDAEPTGYRIGDWELWTAASDGDEAVYVVHDTDGIVERWGRARPPALCR